MRSGIRGTRRRSRLRTRSSPRWSLLLRIRRACAVRAPPYRQHPMSGGWHIRECSQQEASALAKTLAISETTARVLVRRGYADAEAAARFLAGGDPRHDPFPLGDMAAAPARIRDAIDKKERICVHGDYDADGICATALAVLVLRDLGANVDWHLPSRFEEGYGVAGETLRRLAQERCALILTVDCGITAVEEIAEARAAGLELVV